jgi:hypothetical protein
VAGHLFLGGWTEEFLAAPVMADHMRLAGLLVGEAVIE